MKGELKGVLKHDDLKPEDPHLRIFEMENNQELCHLRIFEMDNN